jgi:hypothetical protein
MRLTSGQRKSFILARPPFQFFPTFSSISEPKKSRRLELTTQSLVNPSWIRTPLIERLTSDARWKEKTLEPEDVVNPIVKQVLSGQSGHLVIPDDYGVVSGIRGWPSWLQEALRNSKGHMLDENSML